MTTIPETTTPSNAPIVGCVLHARSYCTLCAATAGLDVANPGADGLVIRQDNRAFYNDRCDTCHRAFLAPATTGTQPATVNGHGAMPHGVTHTTPAQPAMPEARCSVNLFFEVEGMGKGQATGRGNTPQEAAANLKATIAETRAAFAPPAPVVVPTPSREAQVAALLACGIGKAVVKADWERIERLGKAAALVLSGAVEVCAMDGMFTVKSQKQEGLWYHVSCTGVCSCHDYQRHVSEENGWYCKHSLSALMFQRLTVSEVA